MKVTGLLRGLHGNKVGTSIEELHRVEGDLAETLLALAERHRADHEVHHVARDLARWSQEHVGRLSEAGADYGLDLAATIDDRSTVLARLREKGAELTAGFHEPSLLLMADLRHLHRAAAGASLDWEVLAQSAQSLQDSHLLAVAQRCHPETLRQLRWANAMVKEVAAQTIVTG